MDAFFPPQRDYVAATVLSAPKGVVLRAIKGALGAQPHSTVFSVPRNEWRLPLQEYNPRRMSVDIWSVEQQQTMFFPNLEDGWLTLQSIIVERIGCDAASFRVSTKDDEYPIVELFIYSRGQRLRIVRAMRDSSRWEFYTSGDPLPIEDLGQYEKRYVRDRFTLKMMSSYLRKLGWNIADGSHWKPARIVSRVCL